MPHGYRPAPPIRLTCPSAACPLERRLARAPAVESGPARGPASVPAEGRDSGPVKAKGPAAACTVPGLSDRTSPPRAGHTQVRERRARQEDPGLRLARTGGPPGKAESNRCASRDRSAPVLMKKPWRRFAVALSARPAGKHARRCRDRGGDGFLDSMAGSATGPSAVAPQSGLIMRDLFHALRSAIGNNILWATGHNTLWGTGTDTDTRRTEVCIYRGQQTGNLRTTRL